MRHREVLLGALLLFLSIETARAQPPFVPPSPRFANGLSIDYARQTRKSFFGLSFNTSRISNYGYGGYGYGYPGVFAGGNSYTQIIVYSPPPPPPIVLAAPLAPVNWEEFIAPPRRPGAERPPRQDIEPPLKKPEPQPEKPKEPDKPKEEPPQPPPRLPRPQQPHADAARELEELMLLGRIAFASQLHGLAVERFAQAVDVAPPQPLPWFLLAQAYVAVGKYRQAVEAIQAGMARAPDWPRTAFQPLQLYGDHPGDYSDHLLALEEAIHLHPDDPYLLFLQGYQLWFDGRQAEAAPYFERVLSEFPNKGIEKFLQALPGTQVY